jgi:putative transposase
MPYSLDLRQRVIEFIETGEGISKAAKTYRVSRATIYRWLGREELKPTKVTRRKRKLDWEAVRKDVEQNPDLKLSDRAKKFGVRTNAVWYAIEKMKITRKKKISDIEKEIEKKGLSTIEISES